MGLIAGQTLQKSRELKHITKTTQKKHRGEKGERASTGQI